MAYRTLPESLLPIACNYGDWIPSACLDSHLWVSRIEVIETDHNLMVRAIRAAPTLRSVAHRVLPSMFTIIGANPCTFLVALRS